MKLKVTATKRSIRCELQNTGAIVSELITSYLSALPQVQSTPGSHESHLAY